MTCKRCSYFLKTFIKGFKRNANYNDTETLSLTDKTGRNAKAWVTTHSAGHVAGTGTRIYLVVGMQNGAILPRRIRPMPLPCDPANPPSRTYPETSCVYTCTALREKLMGNITNGCIRLTMPDPTNNLHTTQKKRQPESVHLLTKRKRKWNWTWVRSSLSD